MRSAIAMKLERDGTLSVTERVTVTGDKPATRSMSLRQPDASGQRVFSIADAAVEGAGQVRPDGDQVTMSLPPGASTVRYSVDGVVAGAGGDQDVRWWPAGGWDVAVTRVDASLIVPKVPLAISCQVGPEGGSTPCSQAEIAHTQAIRAAHEGLRPGDRMELSVRVPAGTVPSNARVEKAFGLGRLFEPTPLGAAGLAGLGVFLALGFGVLWSLRGRDTGSEQVAPVDVLMEDADGGVGFASPDGVLPGEVGTVGGEDVGPVDVSATVVDLAVRNYIWIEELPGEQGSLDWRFVRLNPPDEALCSYERAVYELLFGQDHGPSACREVWLSQVGVVDLRRVRAALSANVVAKGWFRRKPGTRRGPLWWTGVGLVAVGIVVAMVLVLTTSSGLFGVDLVVAGVALVVAARFAPARTARGRALMAQVRGLSEYLAQASAASIPLNDREMVFSRSLAYAIVLGQGPRWLSEFAAAGSSEGVALAPSWYGERAPGNFWTCLPTLLSSLDHVFGQAGRMRG